LHPTHGYYQTRKPFGTKGDFTTAPEISQMFGELLGLCLAQAWLDQGSPAAFTLAELGPGRGTLMADLLRATRAVPGFHAAMSPWLIEASGALRDEQARVLAAYPVQWAAETAALPDGPLFLIANEFFDALPIRQFQREDDGWRERLVGLSGAALAFGLSDPLEQPDLSRRFHDDPVGAVVEVCPSARLHITGIAQRLHRHGGLALIVDYGGWRSKGDTLQAVKDHAFCDPLAEPGLADLSGHVDFEYLALSAPGLGHAYASQGAFLAALGIARRAERLAANLSGPALESHLAAFHRLTDPAEMGSLFKVLALYPAEAPPPPGFS
jgi:SAM-dependent MidA family methyltransferase